MGKGWLVQSWPAELEGDRTASHKAAAAALAAVDGALSDPDFALEARARANVAFRSAQRLMLAAAEYTKPAGGRWSRRHSAIRSLVEQNAAAGVDLVASFAQGGDLERRRLLLDLLSLLSDLVYFLDVLGRRCGGVNGYGK